MADIRLMLGWSLASVFVIAGMGKLESVRRNYLDSGLALAELAVAGLVMAGIVPIIGAALACCMTVGYVVYAFARTPAERCQCFGKRLPTTGRAAQRFRNLLLMLIAVTYACCWLVLFGNHPTRPILDLVAGVTVGVSILATPWLVEWLAGDSIRQ